MVALVTSAYVYPILEKRLSVLRPLISVYITLVLPPKILKGCGMENVDKKQ